MKMEGQTTETVQERRTTDGAVAHNLDNQSALVPKIKEMAADIRVPPEWLEFERPWFTPQRDDQGHLFITDDHKIIKYYLETGVLEIHPEQHQREDIVDGCERDINLESVMDELINGSGRPLVTMNTPV